MVDFGLLILLLKEFLVLFELKEPLVPWLILQIAHVRLVSVYSTNFVQNTAYQYQNNEAYNSLKYSQCPLYNFLAEAVRI